MCRLAGLRTSSHYLVFTCQSSLRKNNNVILSDQYSMKFFDAVFNLHYNKNAVHRYVKVVIHVEMPKAAPKKSICHFQKLEMILK